MNKSEQIGMMFFMAAMNLVITASIALAQDTAKAAVQNYRVVLENDRVRVLEYTSKPHEGVCGIGMHSHPAHLTIVLEATKVKVTLPDGVVRESELERDLVFWSEAGTHGTENVSTTNSRSLHVIIKEPKKDK
jgi:beta-alanine degradation protein BauB